MKVPISNMPDNWAKPKRQQRQLNHWSGLPSQSESELFYSAVLFLVVRFYWNKTMKIPVTHVTNNGGWK